MTTATQVHVVDHPPELPGELFHWNKSRWMFACPGCGRVATLDHEVTLHEDGTVSISPSLICAYDCGVHVFVERSQVRGA